MKLTRGKQSGIRYGQKKQTGQTDTEQLIKIANYLFTEYKISVKREWYIIFDIETDEILKIKDHVEREDLRDNGLDIAYAKNPDLLWFDKYGMWIIEIDGAVHDRKVKKTLERNALFIKNHVKLIVVNIADLKELDIDMFNYIDQKLTEMR